MVNGCSPLNLIVRESSTNTFSVFLSKEPNRSQFADAPAWCHLLLKVAPYAASAWNLLLGRPPRPLECPQRRLHTGAAALEEFDFSAQLPEL